MAKRNAIKRIQTFQKDPDMAKHTESMAIADSLEAIAENLASPFEVPDKSTIIVKGIKGDKGDKPTEKEIVDLIKPLIPEPIRGEKGDKGDSIKGDKGDMPSVNEVVQALKPFIPDPIKGDQGDKGDKGDPAPNMSPTEIRDALEGLKVGEKLSMQAIDGLTQMFNEWTEHKKTLGGGGIGAVNLEFIDDETPQPVQGSDTVYVLHYVPLPGSLKLYRGGARQRVGEDYSLSEHDRKITWTIAVNPAEILLADYRKA